MSCSCSSTTWRCASDRLLLHAAAGGDGHGAHGRRGAALARGSWLMASLRRRSAWPIPLSAPARSCWACRQDLSNGRGRDGVGAGRRRSRGRCPGSSASSCSSGRSRSPSYAYWPNSSTWSPRAVGDASEELQKALSTDLRLYITDTLADPDEETAWIPTSMAGIAECRRQANTSSATSRSPS